MGEPNKLGVAHTGNSPVLFRLICGWMGGAMDVVLYSSVDCAALWKLKVRKYCILRRFNFSRE